MIAEDSAPVGFADALPGCAVAVAVLAARVGHALVAKFPFPARTAPRNGDSAQNIKSSSSSPSPLFPLCFVFQR